MFLKANSKILWRLTDVLIDRISVYFNFRIFFFLFTPQNNSLLSAFYLVCAFLGLISKVYFVKFYYVHFILCECFESSNFCYTNWTTEAVFSWKSILFHETQTQTVMPEAWLRDAMSRYLFSGNHGDMCNLRCSLSKGCCYVRTWSGDLVYPWAQA